MLAANTTYIYIHYTYTHAYTASAGSTKAADVTSIYKIRELIGNIFSVCFTLCLFTVNLLPFLSASFFGSDCKNHQEKMYGNCVKTNVFHNVRARAKPCKYE